MAIRRTVFFMAIAISASLLVGTYAKGTKGVSKRKMELDDTMITLSKDPSRTLKKLFGTGILKASDGMKVKTSSQLRRLSTKGSKKSKKSAEVEGETESRAEGYERLEYTETITSTTHGFHGKGKGKGSSSKSSKKSSKKCKKHSHTSTKGSSKSKSSKSSKSSKKSSKGDCEEDTVELLPISLYFAQESHDSVVIPSGDDTDEFSWGAVYTYDGQVFMADQSTPIITNSSGTISTDYTSYTIVDSDVMGTVTGRCTRIDPNESGSADFEGKMYCEFSYGFSEDGELTFLTAEGVVTEDSEGRHPEGTLAITGGTGIFRRVVGELVVDPTAGPDSTYYVEVFGDLYLDSRVVDEDLYDEIIASS